MPPLSIAQAVSVIFLLLMVVLVVRGIRGHPRRRGGGEIDTTGFVGGDIIRQSEPTEPVSAVGSDGGAAGD